MKRQILVLSVLFSSVCFGGQALDQRGQEIDAHLRSLELKFEAQYPRANLRMIYCRGQTLVDSHVKLTDDKLESLYRASDAANESALTSVQVSAFETKFGC